MTRLPLPQPAPLTRASSQGQQLRLVHRPGGTRRTIGAYHPGRGLLLAPVNGTSTAQGRYGLVIGAELLGWADSQARERLGGLSAVGLLTDAVREERRQPPAPWGLVRAYAWAALAEGDERYRAGRSGVLVPWGCWDGTVQAGPVPGATQPGLL